MLESEISFHLNLEVIKKELESCNDFSARRLFKAIDEVRYGYLTESSIRMFLKRMGHQVLKPELIAIIRRFDLDGDSRISQAEFVEAIKPIAPDMIAPREKFHPTKRFSPKKQQPSPVRIDIPNEVSASKRTRSADKTAGGGGNLRRKVNKRSIFQMNKVSSPIRGG